MKMSEFGVKKGLLIEKEPTKKMGDLKVLQTHLPKIQGSGFFNVREGKIEGAVFVKLPSQQNPHIYMQN